MENIEYLNSLYQVSEILKYISPNLQARIPKKIKSYLESNKAKDYNWSLDKTLPLEKQELLPQAKEILTSIYMEYICDSAKRIEVENKLIKNEAEYQSLLREKYNPDNMFNRKAKVETNSVEASSMVSYKESFFTKILNKIKSLFRR